VTRQEYNGGLIAKIVEAAMAERYRLYSHLNFTPEQWREAAARYLKLDDALAQLEREDNQVDHDALAENFERCDRCEQIKQLERDRQEFAVRFGAVWARKLVQSAAKKVPGRAA
jgi:hypothetical protein